MTGGVLAGRGETDDLVRRFTREAAVTAGLEHPGVPAIYNPINNHPEAAKYDLKSSRACISGASGLPVEVQQRFQTLTGSRLVEG